VIENGTAFTQNHFFMLLLHLTHEDVTAALCKFLKVIIAEFGVSRSEFERFLNGLNDHDLLAQFRKGMSLLF
jgi:DNA-binding IclR family transcriptional regulator